MKQSRLPEEFKVKLKLKGGRTKQNIKNIQNAIKFILIIFEFHGDVRFHASFQIFLEVNL